MKMKACRDFLRQTHLCRYKIAVAGAGCRSADVKDGLPKQYHRTAKCYGARRLYFLRTARRASWGRAMTLWFSMPVMVSAAIMALMMASSVA